MVMKGYQKFCGTRCPVNEFGEYYLELVKIVIFWTCILEYILEKYLYLDLKLDLFLDIDLYI